MTTKDCSRCAERKPIEQFFNSSKQKDGKDYYCKVCRTANNGLGRTPEKRHAEYERRKAKYPQMNRIAYSRDAKRIVARSNAWLKAHPERRVEYSRRYYERHTHRVALINRRYRTNKDKATPAWANEFFMAEAYRLARLRTKLTGMKWVVDHIVPLQSRSVCGLHTHTNLQVIPATLNASKSNRYWPDMPEVTLGY